MSTKTSKEQHEEHNADELKPPKWLDNEFLANVLKQYEHDKQLVLKTVKIKPASAKGDHYASVMFRVSLKYEVKNVECTKSVIIKTEPEAEGLKKDLLKESYLFPTEIGVYSVVMPKFQKILSDIGDPTVLHVPYVYQSLSPRKIIIFEDIVPLGYTVLRDRPVNLEEAKVALSKLAKWHALSYKLLQEDPNCFDQFCNGFFTMPNIKEFTFVTDGIDHFIEMLSHEATLLQYKPYFVALKPKLLDKCIELFSEFKSNRKPNVNYVLCHGDFHSKNLMLKNNVETGQLEDVMLIDFQACYMGPQVHDLMYIFCMLVDAETRLKHFDELRYFYFETFLEFLKKSGFTGSLPRFSELRAQWLENRHYELFMLVSSMPLMKAMYEGNRDLDAMLNSADKRKPHYYSRSYIEELQCILPSYLFQGYFDDI